MMNYEKNFAPDADGRTPFAFSALRLELCELQGELAFEENCIASAENFAAWQQKVQSRVAELLHINVDETAAAEVKILEVRQRDGYKVKVCESYPDRWSRMRFLMLVPDDLAKPAPAVLCFPGSHHPKEALAGEELEESPNCPPVRFPERNCMALHYVKNGYIALAFDNPATAMSSEIDSENKVTQWGMRTKLVEGLLAIGSSYPEYTIKLRLPVLNWLLTLDEVDKEKIALSGHSLGSEAALFWAVIDKRVRAVVFNDFVCDERIRYCSVTEGEGSEFHDHGNWHCVPGIWKSFAFPDLLAALAPKALALNESGAEEFLDKIRKAYSFCKAADNLQISYYPKFADTPKTTTKVPLQGLSANDFYEKYCAVEVTDHSFRAEPSLKFLSKVFQ